MKLAYKIVLINIAIAVVITAITLITGDSFNNNGGDTAIAFGLVCLGLGLLNLFAGFILLFTNEKEWRTGMFLSSAVLLLLSGISCSGGFSGMRF